MADANARFVAQGARCNDTANLVEIGSDQLPSILGEPPFQVLGHAIPGLNDRSVVYVMPRADPRTVPLDPASARLTIGEG
jgi:hypothetical protein